MANDELPKTGNAFIDSVSQDAVDSQRATGVPASVTLAQAILESGWGKSGLASKYKNYFGIKGKGPNGTIVLETGEHFNGKDVTIKDGFRVYATAEQSFEDHGRFFLDNARYKEAMRNADNGERFAQEIQKAGYATDPGYAKKLIGLMTQFKLARFDEFARGKGDAAKPKPAAAAASLGSGGSVVEELLKLLVKYKFMTAAEKQAVSGLLGPPTHAAVTRMVRDQNKPGKSPVVTEIQQLFIERGHLVAKDVGALGTLGRETYAALTKLLSDMGEPSKPPGGAPPKPNPAADKPAAVTYAEVAKNFKANIPGSKHFTWHEALWLPSDTRYAKSDETTAEILANIVKQALALDGVRDYFKASVVVHCWLRPPAYNAKIGGAKNSAHLRGSATDFHIEGYDAESVRKALRANKAIYPGAGELGVSWVHIDLEHKEWFNP